MTTAMVHHHARNVHGLSTEGQSTLQVRESRSLRGARGLAAGLVRHEHLWLVSLSDLQALSHMESLGDAVKMEMPDRYFFTSFSPADRPVAFRKRRLHHHTIHQCLTLAYFGR